ncbi:hypothetical protein VTK73DRAFT_6595 [Phialemonium thermophilum]|uniref:Proteasome component Ecm29 N-terminal domain-containing protein n=1 Tax=Phialemonium thermophilum TaxID=223376 RepID=A0ABR3WJ81_9PEZI
MAASSSSSSSSSSSEARELELVERVDFRILAAANNEQKLQQLLRTYLPPLLLKAGSEHARVRDKRETHARTLLGGRDMPETHHLHPTSCHHPPRGRSAGPIQVHPGAARPAF